MYTENLTPGRPDGPSDGVTMIAWVLCGLTQTHTHTCFCKAVGVLVGPLHRPVRGDSWKIEREIDDGARWGKFSSNVDKKRGRSGAISRLVNVSTWRPLRPGYFPGHGGFGGRGKTIQRCAASRICVLGK